jgi:hypothetical protein
VIDWYQLPVLGDDGRWESPPKPRPLPTPVAPVAPVAPIPAADAIRRPGLSRARAAVTLLVVIALTGAGLAGAIGFVVGVLALVLRRAAGG